MNLFFLFLLVLNVIPNNCTYESHYIPESNEFEKNNLWQSISINKRKFYPKYNTNNIPSKKYFHELMNLEKISSIQQNYDFHTNKLNGIDKFNNFTKVPDQSTIQVNIHKGVNPLQARPENSDQNVFSSRPTNIPLNFKKSPIYFTNPTTGIVYAITEIGHNYTKPTNSLNGSIPIYIPKEQYDRDMNLLKLSLMRQCKGAKKKEYTNIKGGFNKKKQKKIKIKKHNIKLFGAGSAKGSKKKKRIFKKKLGKDVNIKKTKGSGESDEYKDPLEPIKDMFYEIVGESSEEIPTKVQNSKLSKNNSHESYTIKSNLDLGTQMENPKSIIEFPSTTMKILTNVPLKKPKFDKTVSIKMHDLKNKLSTKSVLSANAKPLQIKFGNSVLSNNEIFKEHKKQLFPKTHSVSTSISMNKQSSETIPEVSKENNQFIKLSSLKFVVKSDLNKSSNTLDFPFNSDYQRFNFSLQRSKRSLNQLKDSERSNLSNEKLRANYFLRSKSYISPPLDYSKENQHTSLRTKYLNRIRDVNGTDDPRPIKEFKQPVLKTALPLNNYKKKPWDESPQIDEYNDTNEYQTSNKKSVKDKSTNDPDDDYFITFEDFYFDESSTSNEDSGEVKHKKRKNFRKKESLKNNELKAENDDDDDDGEDDDDDDDNDGDDEGPGIMEMVKAFVYPFQKVLEKVGVPIINNINGGSTKIRKGKFPKYTTLYDKFEDTESGSSSWFNWFGLGDYGTDKLPYKEPGWFESWFGDSDERQTTPSTTGEEDEDDAENWFSSWFESKSKKPAIETTPIPLSTQVPILTIANPMKNPQKWIGILAQHIVNSTSTVNPLLRDYEPKRKSYDKYQMWRLKPFGENQVKVLEKYKFSEEGAKLEWLSGPTLRGLTDVLIPPKLLTDFQGTLNYEDIAHEVIIFNVGKAIQFEIAQHNATRNNLMSVNRYKDYDDIIRYVENIQLKNPNLVELFHIGRSYEGRPLVIVKVATKNEEKKRMKLKDKIKDQNSGVFIEGGVYGREWVTTASAIWIINELVKIMKNNKTNANADLIKSTNWYVMPVLNPDGYQYSHDFDRFWQKSRSKNMYRPGIFTSAIDWIQKTNSEKLCFGVDLDQNWEYDWGKSLSGSDFPCSEFFIGSDPFSEPETKALSKFLMDYRNKLKLYVSLQSYGHIISYPTKINKTLNAQRTEDLLDVAMVGNDALRKSGSDFRFKLDSSNDLVVSKSGSSNYYALYEVGIPFAYTLYLGDNGVHGYLLPASHIDTAARNAFEIIKGMIDYI